MISLDGKGKGFYFPRKGLEILRASRSARWAGEETKEPEEEFTSKDPKSHEIWI